MGGRGRVCEQSLKQHTTRRPRARQHTQDTETHVDEYLTISIDIHGRAAGLVVWLVAHVS